MKTFYIGLKDKLVLIKETISGYDFKECLYEKQPTRLACMCQYFLGNLFPKK